MTEKHDTIIPFQSEKQLATELKEELRKALEEVALVMDKCVQNGFNGNFAMQMGPNGRHYPANLSITKHY